MHDCEICEKVSYCLLAKDTEVWEYNDDIKDEMNSNWYKMQGDI